MGQRKKTSRNGATQLASDIGSSESESEDEEEEEEEEEETPSRRRRRKRGSKEQSFEYSSDYEVLETSVHK